MEVSHILRNKAYSRGRSASFQSKDGETNLGSCKYGFCTFSRYFYYSVISLKICQPVLIHVYQLEKVSLGLCCLNWVKTPSNSVQSQSGRREFVMHHFQSPITHRPRVLPSDWSKRHMQSRRSCSCRVLLPFHICLKWELNFAAERNFPLFCWFFAGVPGVKQKSRFTSLSEKVWQKQWLVFNDAV